MILDAAKAPDALINLLKRIVERAVLNSPRSKIQNIAKPDQTISLFEWIKALADVGQFARTPNYRAIILAWRLSLATLCWQPQVDVKASTR